MYVRVNLWFVVLVSAVVGGAVGVLLEGREASAQAAGPSEGRAGHVIALTGAVTRSEQALYVVDTREQTVRVYEYGLGKSGLELSATRTFKYDKRLAEFDVELTGGQGPSVQRVRKMIGD